MSAAATGRFQVLAIAVSKDLPDQPAVGIDVEANRHFWTIQVLRPAGDAGAVGAIDIAIQFPDIGLVAFDAEPGAQRDAPSGGLDLVALLATLCAVARRLIAFGRIKRRELVRVVELAAIVVNDKALRQHAFGHDHVVAVELVNAGGADPAATVPALTWLVWVWRFHEAVVAVAALPPGLEWCRSLSPLWLKVTVSLLLPSPVWAQSSTSLAPTPSKPVIWSSLSGVPVNRSSSSVCSSVASGAKLSASGTKLVVPAVSVECGLSAAVCGGSAVNPCGPHHSPGCHSMPGFACNIGMMSEAATDAAPSPRPSVANC